MPGRCDFEVKRNESFTGHVLYKASGVAVNLTGYSGYLSLYAPGESTPRLALDSVASGAELTLGGASGTIDWRHDYMSGIPDGNYNYDLLLVSPGGIKIDLLTGITHTDQGYAP